MNTSEMKTPKNLRIEREPYPHLRDDEGCVLASDHEDERKTAYIIRAVNCFDELLEALKAILADLEQRKIGNTACGIARTAIAKATGEPK